MTTLSQSADGDDALDSIMLMRNRIVQSKLNEISAQDLTQLIQEVLALSSTRPGSFHQLTKLQSAHVVLTSEGADDFSRSVQGI